MSRLRWKLLAAMITLVVVTIGLSGLFTRRVAHDQVRRLLVAQIGEPLEKWVGPIEEHFRADRGWAGINAAVAQVTAGDNRRVVVTDTDRQVRAVSPALRTMKVVVDAEGRLSLGRDHGGRMERMIVRVPPVAIRDAAGTHVADVFVLPREEPATGVAVREIEAVDRRLVSLFAIATLVALLLTFFISRRITRPIEKLTIAVGHMARGETPAHVEVGGRDEIAQLAASFNSMADSLAKQRSLRQRMVGDVAHELRTPLTNLRCELEAIQDGLAQPDPPRIASIHEEVLHLQRLVEDLQELAVADAGALQLQLTRLDLGDAVRRAAAGQAELTIEEAVFVNADPTRIRQIVQNLLSNARTHGGRHADIRVRVTHDAANAIVSVSDNGPGIPAEHLEGIFERFYRLDEARGRDGGGAGLGLAIVRRLVELHGGQIRADSSEGAGATFTFTIPLARS